MSNTLFQHIFGIHVGTNYAPLLTYLLLYLYEADFMQGNLKNKDKNIIRFFDLTFYGSSYFKSSLRKFYGHHDYFTVMEYLCHK